MAHRSNGGSTSTAIHENRAIASAVVTTTANNLSPTSHLNNLRISGHAATSPRRRVSWTVETVDNEGMGKKKSKCCCVYQKPRSWNESSSEDENEDDECQNCRGHRKADYNSKRARADNSQKTGSSEELHHKHCDLHHSKSDNENKD